MSRFNVSAHEGAAIAQQLASLADRLDSYAREHGLRLVEDHQRYELLWFHGVLRYFIEIDKSTAAVRSGVAVGPSDSVRYHASTYLGSSRLEELLDRQREFAEHD
jgi:hypothetical protein